MIVIHIEKDEQKSGMYLYGVKEGDRWTVDGIRNLYPGSGLMSFFASSLPRLCLRRRNDDHHAFIVFSNGNKVK